MKGSRKMQKHKITGWLLIVAVLSTFSLYSLSADESKESAIKSVVSKKNDEKVYELRTYHTPEGKLPKLHKRFRDHTIKLFAKHGMKNVIYFTPVDKPNTLVYLLEHKSKEAAKASWKGFLADEEWKKAYKESIANGKLVYKIENQFLKTTDYSPQK